MKHQNLISDLKRLHDELSTIDSVDAEERRALNELMTDIEEVLRSDSEQPARRLQLRDRLRVLLVRLEARHPRLTLAIERALESLVFLGI